MLSDSISDKKKRRIQESPVAFVDEVLNRQDNHDKHVFEYQKNFLESNASKFVWVAGRQVGKTTSIIWKGLHEFATNKDHNVLFVAPTQRQAVELFHEKLKAEIPEWVDNPASYGLTDVMKTEIRGANGSRMKALPAANKGETIRVFTADTIIVDEAAFIEDEVFTSVLIPMLLTTSGDFILAGTPWGHEGYFHDKYQDSLQSDTGWESIKVPTLESPLADEELIGEMKKDLTENEYKREVLAEFASKGNTALPEGLIKSCIYRGGQSQQRKFPNKAVPECYLGVDIATGGKSHAVFTSVDGHGNVFDIDAEPEATIPQIETKVQNLHRENNYNAIRLDMTGLGEGPVSNLTDSIKVCDGVRFTLNSKQAMYNNMKKLMEEEELTIPDHERLLRELRAMELDYTPRGKTRIQPPDNGTDDYFDSLMLAVDGMVGGATAPAATGTYILDEGRQNNATKNRTQNRSGNNGAWTF